jgi:hypothetical protein
METTSREEDTLPFYPGTSLELWWGGGTRFQLQSWGYWGDAMRWISDGQSLLRDPLSLGEPPTYSNTAANMLTTLREFQAKESLANPLIYFLSGEAGLTSLLGAEGSVVANKGGFHFTKTVFGNLDVKLEANFPWQLSYDNRPYLESMNKQFPDWFPLPTSPISIVGVRVLSAKRVSEKHFNVTLPKGTAFIDERKDAPHGELTEQARQ